VTAEMQKATARMLEDEQMVAELEHQLSMAQVAVQDLSSRCEHLQRENEDLNQSATPRSRGRCSLRRKSVRLRLENGR